MINRHDVITASGDYPERIKSAELTAEVKANIDALILKVNSLLKELGVKSAKVSSGFRPSAVNAGVAGAAKKSNHMLGLAVDLLDDKKQSLAKSITKELLIKHGLFMESPDHTIGKKTNWCHLQSKPTASGNRIFIP